MQQEIQINPTKCLCLLENGKQCMNNQKYDGFCSVHRSGNKYQCTRPIVGVQVQPPIVARDLLEQKDMIVDVTSSPNLKEILLSNFEQMKQNGLFSTITSFELGTTPEIQEQIKSLIQNIDWTDCPLRTDNVTEVHKNSFGHEFYATPCRIGRKQEICNFAIKNNELVKSECPICNLLNYKHSPCLPYRFISIIFSDGFNIIPNLFPYFTSYQYLITLNYQTESRPHDEQDNIYEKSTINNLSKLAPKLLVDDDDTLFFNGIVGNSLKHFHIQYVTYHFPIYDFLMKDTSKPYAEFQNCKIKIFNDNSNRFYFRCAYSIQSSDIKALCVMMFYINSQIKDNRLEINFILHKGFEYECVIFPRTRFELSGLSIENDQNFGSTELSGYVSFIPSPTYDYPREAYINLYLSKTNNIPLGLQKTIIDKSISKVESDLKRLKREFTNLLDESFGIVGGASVGIGAAVGIGANGGSGAAVEQLPPQQPLGKKSKRKAIKYKKSKRKSKKIRKSTRIKKYKNSKF
jgi:hypothetical protein